MIVNHTIHEVFNPMLKDYIDNYLLFEFEGEFAQSFPFKVPPMGFPTMLFCFGNPIKN